MRLERLLAPTAGLILGLAASITTTAVAETIIINEGVAVRESAVQRPARGMSMEAVEEKFGAPGTRHEAVGSPPITRWDYPDFSVFFEYRHVIHAVAKAS